MASCSSLVERLEKDIECSECHDMYTDPKTLPCLHTFCCHCLKQLAKRRKSNQEPIACPDCKTEINLTEGSTFDAFSSSSYLNRLKDIVSVQQEGDQALCGSCDNKSRVVAFYFNCECFICAECRHSHSRYKAMKGHRMTAFNEIKDEDVQEILRRPQLCQEKFHTSAVLEYFCKTCQRCICQKCGMLTHKNHDFEPLDEATEQAKSRLEETEAKIRERVDVWREQTNKDQETHRKTKEQVEEARKAIHDNTQRCIEVVKRHEHELFTQLDTIQEDQERKFQNQKENSEQRLSHLNSVTDYLVSVSQRRIGEEMLRAEQSVLNRTEEIFNASAEFQPLKNVYVDYKRDEDIYQRFEHSPLGQVHVEFAEPDKTEIKGLATNRIERDQQVRLTVITKDSENNICYSASQDVSVQILSPSGEDVQTEVRDGENGTYNACFTAHTVGIHHLTVRVRGQCTANSPLDFHVYGRIPRCYKNVATFKPPAWTERKPGNINCISVDSTGNVAMSDCRKHNVQRFTADGEHLREFGYRGSDNRQFNYPTGIAHNKDGNIIVADSRNHRIKVHEPSGWWIRVFGEEVLKSPWGVSVTTDDNIVVCDTQEEKVSVFSPEGVLLLQFAPSQGTPSYAIFHDNKFFVSVNSDTSHMLQVFDSCGSHLYNIDPMSGGWGRWGESFHPRGLAINKDDLLLVCDTGNDRVQVLTLDGNPVTYFGSCGSDEGDFNKPEDIAITPDEEVIVNDKGNQRIQVFKPKYK